MKNGGEDQKVKVYLDTLPDLAQEDLAIKGPQDFSLDHIRRLLDFLGKPEKALPAIHIAGSNGKGSVLTFCAAALIAAGYKVATFTSPHLGGYPEGIRINGEAIAPKYFLHLAAEIQPLAERIPQLSSFEFHTALALEYFRREEVDIAVVEAGLGGRLDATNVVTPLVSVITPIDLEHRSILGDSLAEIAAHKAGIIKPGVPVVLAPQAPAALEVLLAEARVRSAPVTQIGKDVKSEMLAADAEGQSLHIQFASQNIELRSAMLGPYQAQNAATAFATLQALNGQGTAVDLQSIRQGFARARWPGRFQLLEGDPTIILDAAHTPAAAQALAAALQAHFPDEKVILVLGLSSDKDVAAWLEPLKERVRSVIATQSVHPRALEAAVLAERVAESGLPIEAEADFQRALERAHTLCGKDELVLVAGSVFLVEQAASVIG